MDIHRKGLLTMLLDALRREKTTEAEKHGKLHELRLPFVLNFSYFLVLSPSNNIVSKPMYIHASEDVNTV